MNLRKIGIFLLILLGIDTIFYGQKNTQINTDSLIVLSQSKNDSVRYDALKALMDNNFYSNPAEAMQNGIQLIELTNKLGWKKQHAMILINIGILHYENGKFEEAEKCQKQALDLSVELKDTLLQARCLGNLGNTFMNRGDYKAALTYFMQALDLFELKNYKKGISTCYGAIGNLYLFMEEYEKAESFYQKARNLYAELGNRFGEATTIMDIGLIYKKSKRSLKAIDAFSKSALLFQELSSPRYYAQSLANIGNTYTEIDKPQQALSYVIKANKIFHTINAYEDIALSYTDLAEIYFKLRNYDEAISQCQLALQWTDSIESINLKVNIYFKMKQIYAAKQDFKNAWLYGEKYIVADSLLNRMDKEKEINKLKVKFETEQKEKEIALLNAEKQVAETKIMQQKLMLIFSVIGLVMLVVMVIVVYNRYLYKKRTTNELQLKNAEITQQKEEIEAQRDEIESQRNHIALKNKTIFESITYAQSIQSAILPNEDYLKNYVRDAFILYLPKDIVSGDFYWFDRKNDLFLLASIDCTGHGVPGAFMSFVAYNLLNQAFYELNDLMPERVMSHINEQFLLNYRKYEDQHPMSEGIELVFCVFDFSEHKLYFSGNGALFIHVTANQFNTYKTRKNPLGFSGLEFERQTVNFQSKDQFVFYSDGFADQFGGINNKKFSNNHFLQLVQSIHGESFPVKKQRLVETFQSYKGTNAQVDDVMIIGIEV